MLFFLLAVKSKGNGAIFCLWALAQGNRCCSNQWYALVRRAIKHIKIHPCSNQGLGIKISQTMDVGTCTEQSGIKKIRASTPSFQHVLSKPQNPLFQGKLDELIP